MSQESRPGENSESGVPSETELDAILEEASSLVRQISGEVGAEDTPPEPASDQAQQPLGEPSRNLDEELAALDNLVASTAADLDAAPKPIKGQSASTPSTGFQSASPADPGLTAPAKSQKKPPARTSVPDFMLEFTEPGEEVGTKPAKPAESRKPPAGVASPPAPPRDSTSKASPTDSTPSRPRATASSKPGVVGTGMLGVVTKAIDKDVPSLTSPPRLQEHTDAEPGPLALENMEEESGGTPPKRSLIDQLLLPIVSCIVILLERANRPFDFVGQRARQLLGWVAIATIGTALVLFALAIVRG